MATTFSFYNIIRFSYLPNLIVEKLTGKTEKCKKFYSSFLREQNKPIQDKLTFDIGANKGNKSAALLDLGFKVIAVDPENDCVDTLRWRFGKKDKVVVLKKGVSEKPGTTEMFVSKPRSGLNTMSSKWVDVLTNPAANRWGKKVVYRDSYPVELTTLDQLIEEYGMPYFIKIDVEGYEYKVLKGLHHKPKYLSFETNLPEFVQETIDCIEALNALSENVFNYSFSEKLESETWLTDLEMLEKINDPAIRYMEIICKFL